MRTAVKPHRYKAVWYAGRGVDGNSRLEALTNHLVRVALPPFVQCARCLTRARSIPVIQPYAYCLAWDSLRDTYGGRGFRLIGSSLLSPSAVRSLGAIKKKNHAPKGKLCGFFNFRRGFMSPYVFPSIPLMLSQKYGD